MNSAQDCPLLIQIISKETIISKEISWINLEKGLNKSLSRYFIDERVSLPQIKTIQKINRENPFSVKKIS